MKDAWVEKLRNFLTVVLVGFALGSITSNYTYTYQIMKDCEMMKQFRVGSLAYTCMLK